MSYAKGYLPVSVLVFYLTACGSTAPQHQVNPGQASPGQTAAAQSNSAQGPQTQMSNGAPMDKEAQIRHGQAITYLRHGKLQQALVILERLTVEYPHLATPHANLGLIYQQQSRLDLAEKSLRRAVELGATIPMVHNQLGIVLRKTGKFNQAREQYEQALRIDPNYALAHLNLGILLDLYIGDLGPALDHYQSYQQISPVKDQNVAQWITDLKRRSKGSADIRKMSKTP